ncbi:MAG: hypothetical protein AAGA54_35430 [Myxococcota bacterium]
MTAAAHVVPEPAPASRLNLRQHADAVFEAVSPYEGVGFRHHCKRLFHFASMLMAQRGIEMPADVAYAIAMWHDLGIVSEQDEGTTYLQRSRALFEREIAGMNLDDVDRDVVTECLLYNHRLLPVPNLSGAANCFRQAVQIEHARGLIRFGLSKTAVKAKFQEFPRGNFDRVLMDFTWRTLRREPLTLVRGVFF